MSILTREMLTHVVDRNSIPHQSSRSRSL